MFKKQRFCKILATLVLLKLIIVLAFVLYYSRSNAAKVEYLYREELILDTRKPPNDSEILASIQRELPALPFESLNRTFRYLRKSDACAPFPHIFNIKYHDNYWQSYQSGNVSFDLFGAYYDKRDILIDGPAIRILAMVNQIEEPFPPSYCQLWFENRTEATIVNVTAYNGIWHKAWGHPPNHLYSHLLTCKLSNDTKFLIPQSVSLVSQRCAMATNYLKVIYEEPKTKRTGKNFAVCVKGLDFPYVDMSVRLVEWLELMRILGADQVIAYDLQVHPNVTKVLKHYQDEGFLKFTPITLSRGIPSVANFRHFAMKMDGFDYILNEVIPYNDCFYRNMYKYDYLAVVDVDEVLMPLGNLTNWHELIAVAEQIRHGNCKRYSSFCFRNVYFPQYTNTGVYSEDAPAYLYMMQHVQRIDKHLDAGYQTKCLHSTKYVVTLHNHFPIKYEGSCSGETLNITLGQLQHYRQPDPVYHQSLNNSIEDPSVWRFKQKLVDRSVGVLRQLGFLRMVNRTAEMVGQLVH